MKRHGMKRRPGRLICPACKYEADHQPSYMEGIRTFQNFICDGPDCPVSSFRVEWRSPQPARAAADRGTP